MLQPQQKGKGEQWTGEALSGEVCLPGATEFKRFAKVLSTCKIQEIN